MKTTIKDLLQDADPLQYEPQQPVHERELRRQAVVAAASHVTTPTAAWFRPRMAVLATVTLAVLGMVIVGSQMWSKGAGNLQAAVRFEVRLAEDSPATGLEEATILTSGRTIYLHPEVIATNSDIAEVSLIEDQGSSAHNVGVEFNTAGAQKMLAATVSHIGKPMAILIDGEVVMAPVLRSLISTSALIDGNFTRAEAERIVNGIGIR